MASIDSSNLDQKRIQTSVGEEAPEMVLDFHEDNPDTKPDMLKKLAQLEIYLKKTRDRLEQHAQKIDKLNETVTGNKDQIERAREAHQLTQDIEYNV